MTSAPAAHRCGRPFAWRGVPTRRDCQLGVLLSLHTGYFVALCGRRQVRTVRGRMSAIADTDLLTTSEVAQLLRVRPRTVRRWVSAGTLPAVRLGAAYRIPADELEARLTPAVPPRHPT